MYSLFVYLSWAKIFYLVFSTGGLNLNSQLLYVALSYILHANETINTPTHLSDASLCRVLNIVLWQTVGLSLSHSASQCLYLLPWEV